MAEKDIIIHREHLEQAIAAQESLRGALGDAIVDATITALREKLAALTPPPEQQRKLATILFMDIAGHTALTVNLDPEEQMALVDPIVARLAKKVEAFGGHIARFQGDGFKAVFGLPVAQENDPEHAIRAGLAIQDKAQTIAQELEAARGLSGFRVRVGITTGLIFAGGETEGEDTIKGLPVNLAARLESAAEPGSVLIAYDTYKQVRGIFDFEALSPIQVKGFSEPVQVYRVLRAKALPFYRGMRGVEGVETHMIGREGELKILQDSFFLAHEHHERQVVTIVGDAGLGKSRLMYEFENWADLHPGTIHILKGRAHQETEGLPYALLRSLLAFRFGIQEDDPGEMVQEKLLMGIQEALSHDPRVEMKTHFIGGMVGYHFEGSPHLAVIKEDSKQLRDRAVMYLAEFFQAMLAKNSVLILLEDIHWADDSSLDVFNQLALRLPAQPLLIVGAARPTLFERRPHWGEGMAAHTRLALRPLTKLDSLRLVDEILQKVAGLPLAVRDLVVENAEGNPFYVEELIKMLFDQGVIIKREEHWQVVTAHLDQLQVPTTLVGVLQARLDRLPPREHTLLQQASVIGRVFWDTLLAHIHQTNGETREEVVEMLTALRTKELVFQRETSVFADAVEHIFKHDVLREVTYESVLLSLRHHYHGLAAEWLLAQSQEQVMRYTGLIADHLLRAGKQKEALAYLRRAGEEAASAYAHEEAATYFSRALELVPETDLETRWELHLAREKAYDFLGSRERQAQDLNILADLAVSLNNLDRQAETALRQADYERGIGDYSATKEAANRAVELARRAGNEKWEARAFVLWGVAHLAINDYQEARLCLEQGLHLARASGDRWAEARAINALGNIAGQTGHYSQGQANYELSLKLFREAGLVRFIPVVITNLGNIATWTGNYSKAQAYYEEAHALSSEIGDRLGNHVFLGWVAFLSGNFSDAQIFLDQALIITRETRERWLESVSLALLGAIAYLSNNFSKAQTCLEQALVILREIGNRMVEGDALTYLCDTQIALGNLKAAAEFGQQAVDLLEKIGQKDDAMESQAALARVAQSEGNTAEARIYVKAILTHLDTGGSLNGANHPVRILLTCYQVLQADHDPRAQEILTAAHTLLMERAGNIQDEAAQQMYLHNFPWHREIVALWEARGLEEKP